MILYQASAKIKGAGYGVRRVLYPVLGGILTGGFVFCGRSVHGVNGYRVDQLSIPCRSVSTRESMACWGRVCFVYKSVRTLTPIGKFLSRSSQVFSRISTRKFFLFVASRGLGQIELSWPIPILHTITWHICEISKFATSKC